MPIDTGALGAQYVSSTHFLGVMRNAQEWAWVLLLVWLEVLAYHEILKAIRDELVIELRVDILLHRVMRRNPGIAAGLSVETEDRGKHIHDEECGHERHDHDLSAIRGLADAINDFRHDNTAPNEAEDTPGE